MGARSTRRLLRACAAALAVGLSTGLVVAAYRLALHSAMATHDRAWTALPRLGAIGWATLVAATAAAGAAARLVVKHLAPEATGSGVPTVEERLRGGAPLRWRRILPAKFGGGLLATVTGMSLGPEGPSVHMGACLGEAIAGGAIRDDRLRRALVAAGSSAGLAGVFDAPVSGILFAFEELRCERALLPCATVVVAALASRFVGGRVFGEGPLLGPVDLPTPGAVAIVLAAACGLLCGATGVLFNAAIVAVANLRDRRALVPDEAKAAVSAACAIPVGFLLPSAWFGNLGVLRGLLHGAVVPGDLAVPALHGTLAGLAVFAAVKLGFTATSYASGAVGGLFAPPLVIGAALGAIMGRLGDPLAPQAQLPQVLALAGAAAVFAASMRLPLTGIVMVLELTGHVRNGLAVATSVGVACLVAAAVGAHPLYEALEARRAIGSQSA